MISSLRSIFSAPGARVLLVAGERAILYRFAGGELDRAYIVPADEAGLAQFNRCLGELPAAPVCVLVDVVEEEYRQETIPHVGGADRRSVLERKYARLFRGTPYRHALRQGRESEGRRDDSVLLTAITRPEALTPWLTILISHKVPVAGVYSLPILSERLLKRIHATAPNVLLISLHKASGLRQTFFRDGQLKLSRLAYMPRLGSVPFAAHLIGEVEKLRRYLNSLTLIGRDSPLSVYILSHGQLLNQLVQHCRDSEQEKFVLLDIDDVAGRLGVKVKGQSHYSDLIFAHLLAAQIPPNHYAQPDETQFYAMHRMRTALATTSLLTLLASAALGALNFVEGVNFRQQSQDAEQKAVFYQQRYELARQKLPATPVEPREIKTAVDAVAALRARKHSPEPALRLLGAALLRMPDMKLDALSWQVVAPGSTPTAAGNDGAATDTGAEVLELQGHLERFQGDYRGAIALIDGLASELEQAGGVAAVEVLQYPLDTRSEASVSGSASGPTAGAVAAFRMKLVMDRDDGEQQG